MLDEKFVVVAAAVSVAGMVSYLRATLAGRTRPNRVTWALWGIAPLIVFAAQLGEDVGATSVTSLVAGVVPLVILAASFANRGAFWAVTRGDLACAGLSVLALAAWLVTRHGVVAIAFSIVADLAAGAPTLAKAWRRPETESPGAFAAGTVAAAITLLCLPAWSFAAAAFPLLMLTVSSVLFVLVRFPRLRPSSRLRLAPSAGA